MSQTMERQALYMGLGAVGLWSTVATAFKWALSDMSPLMLLWIATGVSWCLFSLLLWRQPHRPALWPERGHRLIPVVAGILNPTLYYLLLFEGYRRLPGQEAMALNYTWALTLAFMAIPLLKHRLRGIDVIAGGVCYSGVLVIATRGQPWSLTFADPTGVGIMLVTTVVWAGYWILNTLDRRPALLAQWQNFTIGWAVLSLMLYHSPDTSWPSGWPYWGAALYVGLFEMGIAFLLWLGAMKRTQQTSRLSNLIFLSPPVSLVLLNQLLGEPIFPSTLVALVMILTGLALQQWRRQPGKPT